MVVGKAILLSLVSFLLLQHCNHVYGASIGLNVKSKRWAEWAQSQPPPRLPPEADTRTADDDAASSTSSLGRRPSPTADWLRVDLSGQVQTLWVASSDDDDDEDDVDGGQRQLSPFLKVQAAGPWLLLSTLRYDFAQQWYGLTHGAATLQWRQKFRRHGRLRRVWPTTVELTGEQGLLPPTASQLKPRFFSSSSLWSSLPDRAVDVGLTWGRPSSSFSSDSMLGFGAPMTHRGTSVWRTRWHASGSRTMLISLPLHRRLQCEWLFSDSQSLVQQELTSPEPKDEQAVRDENWWIPDVGVNALGRVEATNEGWFRSPWPRDAADSSRVGFRLVLTRWLPWNALGLMPPDDDSDPHGRRSIYSSTLLRLDLTQGRGDARSAISASLEAQLEDFLGSVRMVVRQHRPWRG